MPWKRTDPMLERAQFIAAVEGGECSFAECCRRFQISRKSGYKWWGRYQSEAMAGLADRPPVALHFAHALDARTVADILAAKHAHPHWGPRKLRNVLLAAHPQTHWPAISTMGEVLARHGLVRSRHGRTRVPPFGVPLAHCHGINEVWSADFKGQFRLGNHQWCYPFTLSDNFSRYLLACKGMGHPTEAGVWRACEAVFRQHGLPAAIRTDNGSPFASRALGGLSHLSVWWIKLGIRPERIALGQPQQNGRHERMHRTLKAEATRPASATLLGQQRRFDVFRIEYNEQRPHESLNDQTPISVHRHAGRPYPRRLSEIEYGTGTEVRRVRSNGMIKWRGQLHFISEALIGEPIGFTLISEERWQICFADSPLAIFDERIGQLIRPDNV